MTISLPSLTIGSELMFLLPAIDSVMPGIRDMEITFKDTFDLYHLSYPAWVPQ